MVFDVAIIGAGAAGYFTAINLKLHNENLKVVILEKSNKTLSKVKISGGGRCNVTHYQLNPSLLAANYPRGEKFLKRAFKLFNVQDTIQWFENHGVNLVVEADGRMFPKSNSSETIINLFESLAQKLGIEVWIQSNVVEISESKNQLHTIYFADNESIESKYVVVSVGGQNKNDAQRMLQNFNLEFVPSVPSLFTFNILNKQLHELAGLSVQNGRVKITGLKKAYTGPILITHWGLSGPAVLKTSAWYAREFSDLKYQFTALISWIGDISEEVALQSMNEILTTSPKKMLHNLNMFELPHRLWLYILQTSQVDANKKCLELKKTEIFKILENLIRMPLNVNGKTTFKEEFVTAGGIALTEVNTDSMELMQFHSVYATGEVLDIDGITGGFNFQSAWTTAWIASRSIALKLSH